MFTALCGLSWGSSGSCLSASLAAPAARSPPSPTASTTAGLSASLLARSSSQYYTCLSCYSPRTLVPSATRGTAAYRSRA